MRSDTEGLAKWELKFIDCLGPTALAYLILQSHGESLWKPVIQFGQAAVL